MRTLPLFISCLLLAACSNNEVRETLGINRSAPDEFVVVSRPPLSVPPEFDLRPPRPGEAPRVPSAEDQARQQLLGSAAKPATLEEAPLETSATAVAPVITTEAPTGAAAGFLKRAGSDTADASIREKLGGDALNPPTPEAKTLYDKIVGPQTKEPVVDAKKEAERLRSNKDAGKPVTEGDVPNAKEKAPSVIDKLF